MKPASPSPPDAASTPRDAIFSARTWTGARTARRVGRDGGCRAQPCPARGGRRLPINRRRLRRDGPGPGPGRGPGRLLRGDGGSRAPRPALAGSQGAGPRRGGRSQPWTRAALRRRPGAPRSRRHRVDGARGGADAAGRGSELVPRRRLRGPADLRGRGDSAPVAALADDFPPLPKAPGPAAERA